jgi:hypothetical protein
MAASYPGNSIGFSYKQDINDTVIAQDVNAAYDEIKAIGTTLDVNPMIRGTAISTTWSSSTSSWDTVRARLDYAENGINKANTFLVSNAGGSTITSSAVGVTNLVVKAISSQTANLFEAQPVGSTTPVTYIRPDGTFFTTVVDGGGAHL